ncbi:MAG: AraC family transcriptional regulator [Gammaproteobacteria bacterium]|nr:AraC family transcriptional regulator [Gammaproteobacteria bacterium]MCF6361825.1 AraC family transcriptional regulator [Gammaproteobacteria bacterium]
MKPKASSLTSTALLIWKTLDSRGLDANDFFTQSGLDPALLREPNARYPGHAIKRLWHRVKETLQNPCIGLEVASHFHPTTLHALGFAWMASTTLEEAFARLVRYSRIITDREEYRFGETDKDFRFEVHPLDEDRFYPYESRDAAFAVLITMCRSIYGNDFNPLHIEFCRPEPAQPCMGEFHELFRAPLIFSAPVYAMHFDKEIMRKPLSTANADVARANDEIITNYLLQSDSCDIVMQVKKHLTEQLSSGKATQDSIARALNISSRSLQRRLHEAGTHYSEVLNNTRRELAITYIRNSRLSMGEITYLLGFAEVSNFSRAFKRWTGKPPSEYRAESTSQVILQ